MELYNTKTKKLEPLADEGALHEAILSGTHSFKAGAPVNVTSPDGEFGTVPAEKVAEAIQAGFRVETTFGRAVRESVDENKGWKGAIKVGLGQLADEGLTMGLAETIYNRTGDPLEVAKKEAIKKDHPVANMVGGILGGAASLFVPGLNIVTKGASKVGERVAGHLAEKLIEKGAGEVSKQAAGSIAKKLVQKMAPATAGMAAEGLVMSAPHAITEAALGDPEAAGESLLAGVGIGALFGAGGALAKGLAKTSGDLLRTRFLKENATFSESFKEQAAEKAVEALNPTLAQQERLLPPHKMKEVGRDLIDEKIVTPFSSVKQVYEALDARTRELGKQIGDSLKHFDDLGNQIVEHEAALGREVAGYRIDPKDIATKLKQDVVEKHAGTPAYKSAIGTFEREIDNLAAVEGTWSIAEANAQKAAYGDVIANWGLDQPINKKFLQDIYRAINEAVESKIDDIGAHPLVKESQGSLSGLEGTVTGKTTSELLENFKALKKKYGNLETAELISKKSAAREAKNNDFGLTSYILGGAGLAAGSQIGDGDIPTSLMFGAAGLFGRQYLRKYGNQILSGTYDKAGALFAEQSLKKTAERMDQIPSILQRMATGAKSVNPSTASLGATLRLLGSDEKASSSPQSKADRIIALREKLAPFADENVLTEKIAGLSSPLSDGGAPNIGAAFNQKMVAAYQVLDQLIPREQEARSLFAPERKFAPSDADMAKLENSLEIIMDPFAALDRLENGTLTRAHVDTLKAVYPKTFEMIQERVIDASANKELKLPYTKRIKLGLLLDATLDPSLAPERVAALQETFLSGEEGPQQGASPRAPKRKIEMKTDYRTKAQRISSND